ncbi:YqzL family protein [Natronincola peptidivorans]|nr:YqzL family protein [Natronincola peptidivorans]
MRIAEAFWRIFELTGSITAYIMYKKLEINQEIYNGNS